MVVHPTLSFSPLFDRRKSSRCSSSALTMGRVSLNMFPNASFIFALNSFKFEILIFYKPLEKKPHGVMPEYPRVHRDRSKALGWLHQWLPSSQTYSNAKEHHHWILSMEEELWLTKVWNRHCTLIIKSIYLKPFNTLSLRFYL